MINNHDHGECDVRLCGLLPQKYDTSNHHRVQEMVTVMVMMILPNDLYVVLTLLPQKHDTSNHHRVQEMAGVVGVYLKRGLEPQMMMIILLDHDDDDGDGGGGGGGGGDDTAK